MTSQPTTVRGVDPRTGAPVGEPVAVTEPDDLEALLGSAAFAADEFGSSRPQVRASLLRALADRLDAEVSILVPIAMAESGLPEGRLAGEVARTSGQLRLFAQVVSEGSYLGVITEAADPSAAPPRPQLRRWLEPLGPVLVYAASNFPFAFSVLGGDSASGLAAGCPVLVKAHGSHPGTSCAVANLASEVIADLGLPAGIFGLIVGDDQGVAALKDPRVTASGFTGSTAGGRFLAGVAAARERPIPFFGELGSVNPVVVTPAAAAARGAQIAAGFVGSMTLGTGQFCTKPGLLFVPADHTLDAPLISAIEATGPAPMLNARIQSQLESRLSRLCTHPSVQAVARGGALDRGADPGASARPGAWASALLLRTTAKALAADPGVLAEEYFGPNAIVVEYLNQADLLAALNTIEGTLTATVHLENDDTDWAAPVVENLRRRTGRLIVNGWPTGVTVGWAMHHGGPWPSTTDAAHTSVGATAIDRWLRPVCYQDVPDALLPEGLRAANPWQVPLRSPAEQASA